MNLARAGPYVGPVGVAIPTRCKILKRKSVIAGISDSIVKPPYCQRMAFFLSQKPKTNKGERTKNNIAII